MKSMHCVYRGGRFDDQYSLELEGFMSRQEFTATMNSFNTTVKDNPPPPSLSSGRLAAAIIFIVFAVISGVAVAIRYTHHISLMLVMPVTFLLLSAMLLSWRRRMKRKFETSVLHLCACMNATENVRGINFRLSRLAPEQGGAPSSSLTPTATPPSSASYGITIEFDDRYNLLHHFAIPNDGTPRPSSTAMKQPYTFSGGAIHPPTPTSPPSYRVSANLPPSYSHTNLEFPTNVYHPNEKS